MVLQPVISPPQYLNSPLYETTIHLETCYITEGSFPLWHTSTPSILWFGANSFLQLSIFFFFTYLAAPGLSCGTWELHCSTLDLVPWPGIEPRLPALGVWRLNHWATGRVLATHCLELTGFFFYQPINPGILYSPESRLLQRNVSLAPPFSQTVLMLMWDDHIPYLPCSHNLWCVGTRELRFPVDLLASKGEKMLLATELWPHPSPKNSYWSPPSLLNHLDEGSVDLGTFRINPSGLQEKQLATIPELGTIHSAKKKKKKKTSWIFQSLLQTRLPVCPWALVLRLQISRSCLIDVISY